MSKWQKGMNSPNPGGRPKAATALAELVRSETADGKEIVTFLLDVMRGKADGLSDPKSRLWAAARLLDRGFGRPAQHIEVTSSKAAPAVDYSALSDAELEQLERITDKLQRATARPAEVAGDGVRSVH